jgi:hypothetical protein
MSSLLMRLQRSTSLFDLGCFAASCAHANVKPKTQIAVAKQTAQ